MLNNVFDVVSSEKFDPIFTNKQVVERLIKICRLARKYQRSHDYNDRMDMNKELDELYGKPGQRTTRTRQG